MEERQTYYNCVGYHGGRVLAHSNSMLGSNFIGEMVKEFITGLQVVDSISEPLRIYCDNSAIISSSFFFFFFSKNKKRGKRIDIKYLVVK